MGEPTRAELEASYCWKSVDRVPNDPVMTAFKRRARHQQATWRQTNSHPMGSHPITGGDGAAPLGSRLELEYALRTGANFINDNARAAAAARLATPEAHQTLDERRLWADCLSSMPMCFNLLGDLHADRELADRAVHSWWSDVPGTVSETRFEWSPGRRDPEYLGNRTAFDAAVLLELGHGRGVIGIETKYHEHPVLEQRPGPTRLPRYREVTERSGAFVDGALDEILGTELQQIWLDHLLVLAMLQHPSGEWTWGRFVLVHPKANTGFATLAGRYRDLLADPATFDTRTLEELLDSGTMPAETEAAFRRRYLWSPET